jgi:transcriptional regulator with XRE-family HTH domain
MPLDSLGRLIAAQRRARGLTIAYLAAAAGVGRSTLAALESGKLPELGFNKVARICAAAGIGLETRPPPPGTLKAPIRELTGAVSEDLTREAIKEVIASVDIGAWQALAEAVRAEKTGRLADRVRRVVRALPREDPKAAAFVALLPGILRKAISRDAEHPPRFMP